MASSLGPMLVRLLVKLDGSVVNFRPMVSDIEKFKKDYGKKVVRMVDTPIKQFATDRRGRLVREGSSSKEPSPLSEQGHSRRTARWCSSSITAL